MGNCSTLSIRWSHILNNETLIVIGARLNSNRLPKKHLLPLAGKPLIVRLVERLRQIKTPCKIIVATTSDQYNDMLEEACLKADISCVRFNGDVNNLVLRIDCAVQASTANIIAYICGDCPLVEPELIDKLMSVLMKEPQKKFTALARKDKSIHEGIAVYSRAGWNALVTHCQDDQDLEHVGLSLKRYRNIEHDTVYIDEENIYFDSNHRISVDTVADYQFMEQLYERWYSHNADNSIVSLTWVIELIKRYPEIANANKNVLQKKAHEQYQNILMVCEAGTDKGLGQLKRTIRLAKEMQEQYGYGTELLILADAIKTTDLTFFNHQIFHSEKQLLSVLSAYKNRIIIFDIFPSRLKMSDLWREQLAHTKSVNQFQIGIDRCTEWHDLFNHIWVPSFYCNVQAPNITYGWDYYLIDKIKTDTKKNHVLILTGGSDNLSYGNWLADWLDEHLPDNMKPTWLQGPYAPLPKLKSNPRLSWNISKDPNNLSYYLAQAEYVITVHGLSLFEAIACNKKCIVLPSVPLITSAEFLAFKQTNTALCIENFETDMQMISNLTHQHTLQGISSMKVQSRLTNGLKNVCREIHSLISVTF